MSCVGRDLCNWVLMWFDCIVAGLGLSLVSCFARGFGVCYVLRGF